MSPSRKRKVLVVGSGGREHALSRRLAASDCEVLVAPGNAGTANVGRNLTVATDDVRALVEAARAERVDLVVVGPEVPLVAGLADELRAAGIATFGPGREAARLEGSKAFMKRFASSARVPTAPFQIFDDPARAVAFIRSKPDPVVVKADGLCAGKGVVVAGDHGEAEAAAKFMLSGEAFGDAGRTVIVEDRVEGAEASVHVLCAGEDYVMLPATQDHKRIGEGDTGPNTGGMGAYGPTPLVTPALETRIAREIIEPSLRALAQANLPFRGTLFAGVMVTPAGDPVLLEFNVRFGDPETEVLMDLFDGDLPAVLASIAEGRLDPRSVTRNGKHAMGVVLAAEGYPGKPRVGDPIDGLEAAAATPDAVVLHAGTRVQDGRIVTAGGRVLVVTASAPTLVGARDRAYRAAGAISFPGMQMRRDIGHRALT